jgi:hypothetical protein
MKELIASMDWDSIHYEFVIDGEHIGECCVCPIDRYIHSLCIYPQFWNRGYAREMLMLLFSQYQNQRMWLKAYARNTPAIKAYSAVGFNIFHTSPYSDYNMEEVHFMEVITPPKSTFKFVNRYVVYDNDGNEWIFDNESDRNEMALALYQERVYDLWNRTINWYGVEEYAYTCEMAIAFEDASGVFGTRNIIQVEE